MSHQRYRKDNLAPTIMSEEENERAVSFFSSDTETLEDAVAGNQIAIDVAAEIFAYGSSLARLWSTASQFVKSRMRSISLLSWD